MCRLTGKRYQTNWCARRKETEREISKERKKEKQEGKKKKKKKKKEREKRFMASAILQFPYCHLKLVR